MANSDADQNLADMASRLEAALRRPTPALSVPAQRPVPTAKPAADTPRAAPPVSPQMAPPIAPPAAPVAQQAVPAPATAPVVTITPESNDAKPGQSDNVFGSIEEEMASLLGRPSGKPS
jgi:hypothetical protein